MLHTTNNILHPDQTHHHLLFAYFCSIHPSLLDTNGAGAFPHAGIVNKHVSHQDGQLMHVQPRLQHKVTGVMGQRHEHIHVLIRLKQERGAEKRVFTSAQTDGVVNPKPHTPGGAPAGEALEEVMSRVWRRPPDSMLLLQEEVHLELSQLGLRLGNGEQTGKRIL